MDFTDAQLTGFGGWSVLGQMADRQDLLRTLSDGRFEIAGVSRQVIEAFSTRRAEIEAAMENRGLGATAQNQHFARRAALMTRAHKRDVDKEALRETWQNQVAGLGFDAKALAADALEQSACTPVGDRGAARDAAEGGAATRQPDLFDHAAKADPAREAVNWTWSISPSATRCLRTPIWSQPRSPSVPGRPRSRPSSGP